MSDSQQAPAPQATASAAAQSKQSKNPFKKIVNYLQAQANTAANDRFEGNSYLTPRGKEPQQKYRYNRKKSSTSSTA